VVAGRQVRAGSWVACNVARIADWIDTIPRTRHAGPRTSALCAQPPHDLPNFTNRFARPAALASSVRGKSGRASGKPKIL
jgi:hypothetical protein